MITCSTAVCSKHAGLSNEFAVRRAGGNKNKINNSPYPHTEKQETIKQSPETFPTYHLLLYSFVGYLLCLLEILHNLLAFSL